MAALGRLSTETRSHTPMKHFVRNADYYVFFIWVIAMFCIYFFL